MDVKEFIKHVSTKPWSDYSESDYTLQQWHDACLIHLHDSTGNYTKADCKLPVLTPNGALNKNGVHAAAAALAGARGGVDAPDAEKAKAASALVGMYKQLNEKPPPSLMQHSSTLGKEFIEHHGIKGMKWGIRKDKVASKSSRKRGPSPDHVQKEKLRQRPIHSLSNAQIRKVNERINLEQNFGRLNPTPVQKGKYHVQTVLATAGIGVAAYNLFTSPAGKALLNIGKKTVEKA